jgi:A/G-specific adenine glycosylase
MTKIRKKRTNFTNALLKWHSTLNFRAMPWKGEKEPYRIWLSEVILQQTRVDQGWAYYEKFIIAFPTIHDLAEAAEEDVFKLWEGLGYYSRCRNLIATAKTISSNYNGQFPTSYEEILALRGIGPYTAAAIASFAFGLPYAVVDGNVTRVLARYFGISTPTDSSAGKKEFAAMALELLDPNRAGSYNQAIMDFGATVCTPRNPHCTTCVQQAGCVALQKGMIEQLPVKAKVVRKKHRRFYYFVAETPEGEVYIRRRSAKDIWEGLYEFILYETIDAAWPETILQSDFARQLFDGQALTVRCISGVYRQELSHQRLEGQFITVRLNGPLANPDGFQLVSRSALGAYAFPKFINSWLSDPSPAQTLF